MSAADVAVQKIYGSGRTTDLASHTTTLIIANEEIEDVKKIVKSLEESGLLIKGIIETTKNVAKEQKVGFLPILSRTLASSILGNTLTGKWVIRAGEDTNFEIQKYQIYW